MKYFAGHAVFCDTEDYGIIPGLSSVQVVRERYIGLREKPLVIGNFPSVGDAQIYIDRMCNPKEEPLKVFQDICRCSGQYISYGANSPWDYVTTEGTIYELCNHCNQPLSMAVKDLLNSKASEDFDLDAFLNGE